MQSRESPVLEFPQEVPGTDALREVQLPLPVEAQNVLEDSGRTVEEELASTQGKRIAQVEDLTWKSRYMLLWVLKVDTMHYVFFICK